MHNLEVYIDMIANECSLNEPYHDIFTKLYKAWESTVYNNPALVQDHVDYGYANIHVIAAKVYAKLNNKTYIETEKEH